MRSEVYVAVSALQTNPGVRANRRNPGSLMTAPLALAGPVERSSCRLGHGTRRHATTDSRQRLVFSDGKVEAMTTLRFLPVPASMLRRFRAAGQDDFGNPWTPRIDDEGGSPLRCCLRKSAPGDRVVLIRYAPVAGRATGALGGYDEAGPIFVHADECDGYVDDGRYPSDVGQRRQVLRAYRSDGSIARGVLLDEGDDRDATARELLADPEIGFLHSRYVEHGCYLLEIRRG